LAIKGAVVLITGLCVGSFLATVVARGKRLFEKKRSACDHCRRPLFWWENIPVVSFVFLKGRCLTCRSLIPRWYPLVEVSSGLFFLLTFLTWQKKFLVFTPTSITILVIWLAIISLLLLLTVIDFQQMVIPDQIVIALILLTILGYFFVSPLGLVLKNHLLAGLGAAGFLLFLHLVTKGRGMGLGDVKLAVFMGLFLGWPKIGLSLYLAFLTGGLIGVIMILLNKVKLKRQIPFGPFLVVGTIISWWWGEEIIFKLSQWLVF